MKIKEVQAGVKITENYDSYQASLAAELEKGEDPEKIGAELMEKAFVIVSKGMKNGKKFGFQEKESLGEVGAAWPDKKSEEKLSVKYSGSEEWHDVNMSDLEKTNDGYKQKVGDEVFVFRKIPSEKRKNPKMPTFRIYKIGKNVQRSMKGGKI